VSDRRELRRARARGSATHRKPPIATAKSSAAPANGASVPQATSRPPPMSAMPVPVARQIASVDCARAAIASSMRSGYSGGRARTR
jgi:hypothetical protein